MLFAGGGIRTGQVIGATDSKAEDPVERRVGTGDFLATIYKHLGIDPTLHMPDPQGRPIALTSGTPIHELF